MFEAVWPFGYTAVKNYFNYMINTEKSPASAARTDWQQRFDEAKLVRIGGIFNGDTPIQFQAEQDMFERIKPQLKSFIQLELDKLEQEHDDDLEMRIADHQRELKEQVDKARAEVEARIGAEEMDVMKYAMSYQDDIRKAERTRILGIIEEMKRVPGPIFDPNWRAENEEWNQALEALKKKLET